MEPILLVRCDAFETYGVAPSALAAAGATTRIWDAVDPAAERPDLADASGVVVFGSTSNVEHADERPFIKEVADLTHEAVERGVPFLGLCFGAQILAWALGADVIKARVRELGFEPIRALPAAADDPVLSPYGDGDPVFHWHEDTFQLPEGATLLAPRRVRRPASLPRVPAPRRSQDGDRVPGRGGPPRGAPRTLRWAPPRGRRRHRSGPIRRRCPQRPSLRGRARSRRDGDPAAP